MARDDMARYVRWDVQQKKIADIAQQLAPALARRGQEQRDKFAEFVKSVRLRRRLEELAGG